MIDYIGIEPIDASAASIAADKEAIDAINEPNPNPLNLLVNAP
jgi:hypothetical protein